MKRSEEPPNRVIFLCSYSHFKPSSVQRERHFEALFHGEIVNLDASDSKIDSGCFDGSKESIFVGVAGQI